MNSYSYIWTMSLDSNPIIAGGSLASSYYKGESILQRETVFLHKQKKKKAWTFEWMNESINWKSINK